MSVFFATPSHKGDVGSIANWGASMAAVLKLAGASCGIVSNCPWLDAARADLIAAFLKSDCESLFFRDDDISIEPSTLRAMLDLNRPIVSIPYRMRQVPHAWVTSGLGCVLMQRRVINDMVMAYPELGYDQDGSSRWALFHPILENRRLLKEDQAFFLRAKRIGFSPDLLEGYQIDHGGIVDTFNGSGEARTALANGSPRSLEQPRST